MSTVELHSFGGYPGVGQSPVRVYWRDELPETLETAVVRHGTVLPFGAGLSYGDSCLAASAHVISLRPMNRLMAADWSTGTVVAEAGITLEQLLAVAIPRGWFLPVTPGTKFVTLGGAIANDVHGKNHHRRGTFGRFIRSLCLTRSDRGAVTCSPAQETDLFRASIGGLGLTGVIQWAELQFVRIESSEVDVIETRFSGLDEFFDLSAELDLKHEFCVSWLDCSVRRGRVGRGIYMAGDFAATGELEFCRSRRLELPMTPPFPLVSPLTVRAFNGLYWRRGPRRRTSRRVPYDPFFYPLDGVLNWNRIYGRQGLQQYQCLLPPASAPDALAELLRTIARQRAGSFLSVLKRCGDIESPGLLSFPGPGTTLAMDFAQWQSPEVHLFPRMDAIVREAGGRLYPAKDAHWGGEDFRRSYPAWARLEALRDPALMSRFWARVTR